MRRKRGGKRGEKRGKKEERGKVRGNGDKVRKERKSKEKRR